MNDETRAELPSTDPTATATHPAVDLDATRVHPADRVDSSGTDAAGSVSVPGFVLDQVLGRGGMGVVYRATQTGLNRVVALKMLIAGQYADPALRTRFLLEAESVAALDHPHIVRVFAFGEYNGHPYLAMEYLPRGTLAESIKKNGPFEALEATRLLAKLAEAVAHAHSHGVVHRDIKPLNVLLTADAEPRLADFGLAKSGRADQHLSVTGQVLGTPAYMAPEQAAGRVREVGTAADVYALGAVLYDLLTGRPPFQGASVAVTLQKVLTEEPSRPRKLNAAIPRDLETMCLKCLEKDPARRYPTAQALADDLRRYLRNEPISVRPAGVLERGYKWGKRNKVVSGAAIAVFLSLVVGAGLSLAFGREATRQAAEAKKQKREADEAAIRADGEATEAKRLEAEVRDALTRSHLLSEQLKTSLAVSRRRVALNYLAYGQMCATAAKIANTENRSKADRLILEYRRTTEWVTESGDPAIKAAADAFTLALAEWSDEKRSDALRTRSLALAQACGDSWLKNIEHEFPDLAKQIRARLYDRACTAAAGLLARDPVQIQASREEVLELYWGELAIVESTAVAEKMVALKRVLDDWPAGTRHPTQLIQAVTDLHAACDRPFTTSK